MATIYAHTNDGYVARFNQSSWSDARANSSGTAASSVATTSTVGISAYAASSRGGGSVFHLVRSFMYFDTSGISSNVDSATLKIRGVTYGTGDVIAVKATSDIAAILGTADFEAITGWDSSGTDGSGGGDMESSVTKYSNEITTWSTSGYNDIALNAQALADMKNDSTVYIALLNFDHDLKDVEPTDMSGRNGLYYINYTGTSRDPYVDYTLAAVATTDNAIFFGTNF